MQKKRIEWIDIARGIGIILVVYGHALSADSFRYIIYSFHMPLFFFLSGIVFRYRPEETFSSFVRKNTRNILLPYVAFALLSLAIWSFTHQTTLQDIGGHFLSIFYGNGNNNLLINNILWFLPCLFLTRVGFYLLTRMSLRTRILLVSLFVLSVLGYAYSLLFPGVKLPFGFETALTAIVFFGAGYLWHTHQEKGMKRLPIVMFGLLLAIVVTLLFANLNYTTYGSQVDMRKNVLHNYFYFYIAAFSGTLVTIWVSFLLKTNTILAYLGKQSLVIFAWHLMMFPYISTLLAYLNLKPYLAQFPSYVSPILYSILSIIFVLMIAVPVQVSLAHGSKQFSPARKK